MEDKKIRVLIAKPGLDGHDRGAKVLAQGLRDAGMEVIYLGLRLTPEQIAEAAIQEDVDVVGLSCLSGAHMALFPKTVQLIKKKSRKNIPNLPSAWRPCGRSLLIISDASSTKTKKGLRFACCFPLLSA